MGYYPVFLSLEQRRCLVIGGGPVAERKVGGLLEAGASVTVVSPGLTERLKSWTEEGKIRHETRAYRPGDLAGFQLAFVAINEESVSGAVKQEGEERGVWVNVADVPVRCDFILPSVLRRGPLTVAVSTGGLSPALAKSIREELESYFTDHYGSLAEIVSDVRRELRERRLFPGPDEWSRALNGELRRLIEEGKPEKAKEYLLRSLGA